MLQAFAVERGAAGRAAEHEALGPGIGRGPDQIADPLEAEHRVVDEHRDHVHAVRRIGRAGGDERRHRAGFGDAFFEQLAVFGFLVERELIGIDRLVELADVRVDADLAEQAFHAERPRFVGHDRHDVLADLLVAQQVAQQADEAHRGRHFLAGAFAHELGHRLFVVGQPRHFHRHRLGRPRRHRAAQRLRGARGGTSFPGCLRAGDRTAPRPLARPKSECRTACGTRAALLR